jgi:hypothetical protein
MVAPENTSAIARHAKFLVEAIARTAAAGKLDLPYIDASKH